MDRRQLLEGGLRSRQHLLPHEIDQLTELTDPPKYSAPPRDPVDTSHTARINTSTSQFDFPSLASDGTLSDEPVLPSNARHTRTPPAALSSKGLEFNMASTMSDSVASLSDSQYDMVDDVSEVSSDGRDTASLPDTEHHESEDGILTPDDTGSIVDVDEERAGEDVDEIENEELTTTLKGSHETLPGVQKHSTADGSKENSLLDSYFSEEMETPRQSMLRPLLAEANSSSTSTHSAPAKSTTKDDKKTIRVMLAYDSFLSDQDAVELSQQLATQLSAQDHPATHFEYRVVHLPPTPSSGSFSPTLLVRFRDIELIVQRCNGAKELATSPDVFTLQSDEYGEAGTVQITAGVQNEATPDLLILYLPIRDYPYWFGTMKKAMMPRSVPILTISTSYRGLDALSAPQKKMAIEGSDLVYQREEFYGKRNVRSELRALLKHKLPQTPPTAPQGMFGIKSGTVERVRQAESKGWFVLLLGIFFMLANLNFFHQAPMSVSELTARRAALSNALNDLTNSTDAINLFDLKHLVPYQTSVSAEYVGYTARTHSQGVPPNHIVISLPKKTNRRRFLRPASTHVYRTVGNDIDFNLTKLIDGVYDVSIDPEEAHGTIFVNMLVKRAPLNITVSHSFGNRFVQRTTTDIAKTLNKDITVARERVKGFKDFLGLELTAGAAATRNLTSELSVYVARDVQVFVNTFATVFGKAVKEGSQWAVKMKSVIPRETRSALIRVCSNLHAAKARHQETRKAAKAYVRSLLPPTKQALRNGLIASRKKALNLKNRVTGQKKEANSTSATKELSLRLQNFFSPTEKTKRAGSLPDIARCIGAEDYLACRREQRKAAFKQSEAKKLGSVVDKAVQTHSTVASGLSIQLPSQVPGMSKEERKSMEKKLNEMKKELDERTEKAAKRTRKCKKKAR